MNTAVKIPTDRAEQIANYAMIPMPTTIGGIRSMTDCYLCYRPILHWQELDENGNHGVCSLEREKRYFDGICVTCGENKRKDREHDRCSDCETNKNGYKGYDKLGLL